MQFHRLSEQALGAHCGSHRSFTPLTVPCSGIFQCSSFLLQTVLATNLNSQRSLMPQSSAIITQVFEMIKLIHIIIYNLCSCVEVVSLVRIISSQYINIQIFFQTKKTAGIHTKVTEHFTLLANSAENLSVALHSLSNWSILNLHPQKLHNYPCLLSPCAHLFMFYLGSL